MSGIRLDNDNIHTVNRANIYSSVMELYSQKDITKCFPLEISFEGERGIDAGGLYRDMLSGFWEEAYRQLFDGGCLLSPVLHPEMSMSDFSIIGGIISHGYLSSGFLPVRIALPSLAALLFGSTIKVHDDVYIETFLETVSIVEATFLNKLLEANHTISNYSPDEQRRLVSILSRFGCRQLPTSQSLRHQMIQAAHYEYLVKPSAALQAISAGIPSSHRCFWRKMPIPEFCEVFHALAASPERVIESIIEPAFEDQNQERVFGYLTQYVGSLSVTDARRFLRFTTGSSVCVAQLINIVFNNLVGLARRPIGRTCSCTLELSQSYATYLDFAQEFQAVMSSDDSWCMDAI